MTTFPKPAGATRIFDWELDDTVLDSTPICSRAFWGDSREIDRGDGDSVAISVDGRQFNDGTIERRIYIVGLTQRGDYLTLELARELGDELRAAVDLAERQRGADILAAQGAVAP